MDSAWLCGPRLPWQWQWEWEWQWQWVWGWGRSQLQPHAQLQSHVRVHQLWRRGAARVSAAAPACAAAWPPGGRPRRRPACLPARARLAGKAPREWANLCRGCWWWTHRVEELRHEAVLFQEHQRFADWSTTHGSVSAWCMRNGPFACLLTQLVYIRVFFFSAVSVCSKRSSRASHQMAQSSSSNSLPPLSSFQ